MAIAIIKTCDRCGIKTDSTKKIEHGKEITSLTLSMHNQKYPQEIPIWPYELCATCMVDTVKSLSKSTKPDNATTKYQAWQKRQSEAR